MSACAVVASVVTLSGQSPAGAQSNIPPGKLSGRERERFITSLLEKFMKPGPPQRLRRHKVR